jgi:ATP-dependent helicase/nuclease subunit B
VASHQLPQQISPSQYAHLVRCPYRFFAATILGLDEEDSVQEALEKRDYGELLHRILQTFHQRYPRLTTEPLAHLSQGLRQISEHVFAPVIERNYLEHAWRLRWVQRIPEYLAWAIEHEQQGWLFERSEASQRVTIPLASPGAQLSLTGRLDRIDRNPQGEKAVLDYKARDENRLRQQAEDQEDVQLACYTWLAGPQVTTAGYVALDGSKIRLLTLDQPQRAAEYRAALLAQSFDQLHQGAALPAHGVNCDHCPMRGLCRKDYHPSP